MKELVPQRMKRMTMRINSPIPVSFYRWLLSKVTSLIFRHHRSLQMIKDFLLLNQKQALITFAADHNKPIIWRNLKYFENYHGFRRATKARQ
ncbi:hypothetical protein NC653_040614 [Populus alba x Populus x berolinensis]|nr:hypothetical protein NC653_040614 [Populus alba x Populus x berolinensis]